MSNRLKFSSFAWFASSLLFLFFLGANLPLARAASETLNPTPCTYVPAHVTGNYCQPDSGSNFCSNLSGTWYLEAANGYATANEACFQNGYGAAGEACISITPLGGGQYSFSGLSLPHGCSYSLVLGIGDAGTYNSQSGGYQNVQNAVDLGSTVTISDTPFTPPTAVTLAYPTSTTPDFANWVVSWTGTPPYGTMSVFYGLSSTTLNYTDALSFSPYISANPLLISKHQPLWFIPLADPVTWYAEVVVTGATSSVNSTIISFQVSPEYSNPSGATSTLAAPFYGVSSTTITEIGSCATLTSTDPFGIEVGVCNVLSFLFVPSPDQQANLGVLFTNLKTTYGSKPPFGYLTAIVTPFQGFNVSSSLSWPALTNASTTAAFSPVYGIFDAGFAAIVYVLLGFWVFHRARNIEL